MSKKGKPKQESPENSFSLKRYRDIESGKVLPTFEEFFKICILFEIDENVNLKELYPTLYRDFKAQLAMNKRRIKLGKTPEGAIPTSPWLLM